MSIMDKFCNWSANKTALYRINKMEEKAKKDEVYLLNEYNEKVELNPFYKIEKVLSDSRNRIVKLVKEDVYELQKYVWFSIYNEAIILVLMLTISLFLHILLPASIIIATFLISRLFLKGDHLDTLNKCSVFTVIYLVGFSYIAFLLIPEYFNLLLKIVCYVIIGIGLELISLIKVFGKILNKINKI